MPRLNKKGFSSPVIIIIIVFVVVVILLLVKGGNLKLSVNKEPAATTQSSKQAQQSSAPTIVPAKESPSPSQSGQALTPEKLDLNGTWSLVNGEGESFTLNGVQNGNHLTLTITQASLGHAVGKAAIDGTITGSQFSGSQILLKDAGNCNQSFYVNATGTVSNNSITLSYTNSRYDTETCQDVPNSEFQSSVTYTRVK